MPTKRIALYGGSFNPPHLGHVQIVSYVLATTDVDALWLVPCHEHAFSKQLEPYSHRMAMCRLAVRDFAPERVLVSDIEGRIGGRNRTIDTVKRLLEDHADTAFDLVVGTDIFEERHSWKAFDELERLCRFIVVGRRGYPTPVGHDAAPPLFDVSSTDVRRRLSEGVTVQNLIPNAVADYTAEHGLYR